MAYKYQPKIAPSVTAEDVMQQREAVVVIKYNIQELKRDTTRKLKRMRRELLAVQAWLRRHDRVDGATDRVTSAPRTAPPFDVAALSDSEREKMDKLMADVFGPSTA